jgi:hypothetical protein
LAPTGAKPMGHDDDDDIIYRTIKEKIMKKKRKIYRSS